MDLNKFYLFGSGFSQTPVCVSNEQLDYETSCRIAKGDFIGIDLPLSFEQFSGKKWTDVLNPSSVSLYIFSDDFINVLKQNNITGWKTFSIKISDKLGKEVKGYSGFSIVGRCGEPDYTKSHIYEKQLVPNGKRTKYYKGLHIGLDKWDGSDFFIPEKTLHIVITEKVRQIIRKQKITNVILQKLSEYEIAEFALPKKD